VFRTRTKAVFAISGLALLVAACGGAGGETAAAGTGADGLVTITAGVAASQSSTALLMGQSKGFFKEEGIDLKIGKAATGAGAITQLINGQQQAALGGISPVVTAVASNIPVQIVSGAVNDKPSPDGTQYQTMVPGDSPVKSFKDLAGKTVAVNSLKCCWEFWMREAVQKDGGDPNALRPVQLSFPDQITALKQGKVDAISTAQPYATELRQQGFRDVGDSPASAFDNPNNGNTVFYMAKSFVADHPGIVDKWRRALQKSSDYANAHPDEVRATIIKQTSANPDLVASAPLPEYTAKIDQGTVEKEVQFAVKYGVIKQAPAYTSLVVP
jgi:NitT/TauT family transport system substrate-binding protein